MPNNLGGNWCSCCLHLGVTFFLPGCFNSLKYVCKKTVFVVWVCAPILHFSFQQFLDFSSGGGLLRPVKERRPLIVTACLNTVFVWGWSMAKIWQGKGTASWFFLLFGSAFMYFVGDGDNVWDAFLVCWQLFFLGFLSWFLAGLVGPDGC